MSSTQREPVRPELVCGGGKGGRSTRSAALCNARGSLYLSLVKTFVVLEAKKLNYMI